MANAPGSRGIGVDAFGGGVIDPTKNVLDLVNAESKYQNDMRRMEARRQDELRAAETRRLDDLAQLRHQYDAQISENLRVQVKTTSELISTQLDKVTTSLSSQITTVTTTFSSQIAALTAAFTARIADLERFRWEVGGKTSVSDPATSAALQEVTTALRALQRSDNKTEGVWSGVGQLITNTLAIGAVAVAIFAVFHKGG
jgi:transposase